MSNDHNHESIVNSITRLMRRPDKITSHRTEYLCNNDLRETWTLGASPCRPGCFAEISHTSQVQVRLATRLQSRAVTSQEMLYEDFTVAKYLAPIAALSLIDKDMLLGTNWRSAYTNIAGLTARMNPDA